MKPKYVVVFIIVNAILIAGVYSFGLSPRWQDVSRVIAAAGRQQTQIALRTRYGLEYESNLLRLQELHEGRAFLMSDYEIMLELSKIEEMVYTNNLQLLNFAFSEQIEFYTAHGQHVVRTSGLVYGYGAVADVIRFLNEFEETSAAIITADMVWRGDYRARINIEFTLLAVNI